MKNFKTSLILLGAKTVQQLIKLARAGEGTSLVGKLVLKSDPNFIKTAASNINGAKIAVTGTNGKTTTSGIISHILESNAKQVIANRKGANMLTGVANAFALALAPGKTFDNCVIESDEAYLAQIQKSLNADYLLVTNLFKDQVDRYSDVEITKQKIQEGINAHSKVQLVLNADDPLVAGLKSDIPGIYYGVKSVTDNTGTITTYKSEEKFSCPCGKDLKYTKIFYAQHGHYYCDCGYKRPNVNFEADIILEKNYSIIKLGAEEFRFPLIGLFNAYNALAAIALLKTIGIHDIQKYLANFKTAFGRSEIRQIKGHQTVIQLIKNPAGANQVLKSIDLDSNILIIINDNIADGRDISWIWDTNFEHLAQTPKQITVSGTRAQDMATRLKYAGISEDKIIVKEEITKAIDYITTISENDITILPTYTALLTLNKLWKKYKEV